MYFYGQSKEDAPGNHSVTINTAFESFVLSGLGWTTTPPTKEGWYWAMLSKEYSILYPLVLVEFREGTIYTHGNKAPASFESFTHWLGPLPVPEPPKG
jgi:hypothetical protein